MGSVATLKPPKTKRSSNNDKLAPPYYNTLVELKKRNARNTKNIIIVIACPLIFIFEAHQNIEAKESISHSFHTPPLQYPCS